MDDEDDFYRVMMLLLSRFSRVRLCATPKTAAHQAPLYLGFSRQEHWRGCHFLLQCMKVDKGNSSPLTQIASSAKWESCLPREPIKELAIIQRGGNIITFMSSASI